MNARGKTIAVSIAAVAVIGVAIGGPIVYRNWRVERERRYTSSCANHAIQHKMTIILLMHDKGGFEFPPETDTRQALAKIRAAVGDNLEGWLDSYGSACPEAFLRDRSIGYLYLADSLKVDAESQDPALVLICPAESHQGSKQHCHAVTTAGMECPNSNVEMLGILREHLGKATNGVIRYSTNARAIMRREIAAREMFEERRKKTKTKHPEI